MDYIYLNPWRNRTSEHLEALRLKFVFTWSPKEKRARIFRLIWTRGLGPGIAGSSNYSASFSFAFQVKRIFLWCGESAGKRATNKHWRLYLPLVVFHYRRAFGGYQT